MASVFIFIHISIHGNLIILVIANTTPICLTTRNMLVKLEVYLVYGVNIGQVNSLAVFSCKLLSPLWNDCKKYGNWARFDSIGEAMKLFCLVGDTKRAWVANVLHIPDAGAFVAPLNTLTRVVLPHAVNVNMIFSQILTNTINSPEIYHSTTISTDAPSSMFWHEGKEHVSYRTCRTNPACWVYSWYVYSLPHLSVGTKKENKFLHLIAAAFTS